MNEFLNIEDVADDRGEEPAKVARILTRKECKLYLHLGRSEDPILCMTEYRNEKGNYSIYQIKKGVYPMTLKAQNKYVKRISVNNFDLTGLDFISGEDNRLRYLHEEDRTVKVVAKKSDIDLLPKLTVVSKKVVRNKATVRKGKSNPELHKIFWRAFVFLRDEDGLEPQYKQVWETVYNELRAEDLLRDKETIPRKRKHDPHDHIEVIDPVNVPAPKLQWIISGTDSRISNQGTYSLSSLPPLLSKLKKNPPII
jgi:hypothetical protein